MPVANSDLIRAINRFNILNTIRISGAISRVEIAEITGQSRASVTNITARLIDEGLIYEKRTEDSAVRGRRRVLLAMNPDAAYVVGVKLSASRISCAVTDMQAEVRSSVNLPVRTAKRPVAFMADLIEEAVRHCVEAAKLDLHGISGIGIGVPGFVNSLTGTCYWTPLYQQGDIHLKQLVESRLGVDTFIENDTNTVTLAHQWFGEGRGINHFLVITIEDGVGMGIVVNGQLYRGASGFAAEFGHMVVNDSGPPCRCGKRGCLEAYVSDFSILAEAQRAAASGAWPRSPAGNLDYEDVLSLAQSGDTVLASIFDKAGRYLGEGLSALIQIFNPAKIIISGDGVKAGDLMFAGMREVLSKQTNPAHHRATKIVIQKWRDTDWARGAASLVLQELYRSPFNRVRPVI
ncbi:MAG: ROK family transcriptional regulator [Desulfobacteraceae bacterium]|jgi:predicted NBD/HSP70 family sugar kinase